MKSPGAEPSDLTPEEYYDTLALLGERFSPGNVVSVTGYCVYAWTTA